MLAFVVNRELKPPAEVLPCKALLFGLEKPYAKVKLLWV
jgi:hypothetical protein